MTMTARTLRVNRREMSTEDEPLRALAPCAGPDSACTPVPLAGPVKEDVRGAMMLSYRACLNRSCLHAPGPGLVPVQPIGPEPGTSTGGDRIAAAGQEISYRRYAATSHDGSVRPLRPFRPGRTTTPGYR